MEKILPKIRYLMLELVWSFTLFFPNEDNCYLCSTYETNHLKGHACIPLLIRWSPLKYHMAYIDHILISST